MADTKDFRCPNCGSPLTVQDGQNEIKCSYCGSSVIVPKELRTKPAPAPSPTPISMPPMTIGTFQPDEEIGKEVATAGKVVAGIAVTSIIAPLAITAVILCFVGAILVYVFYNVNSAVQTAQNSVPVYTVPPVTVGPSATPEPTQTPIPNATPFTKVILHDNFTNKGSGWDVFTDSNYTLQYVKGGYRMFINTGDGGQSSWIGSSYKDVNVQVDVKITAGPDDGLVGVTCRAKDGVGFYSFEFSRDGYYSIEKYSDSQGQSNSTALADGTLDPNTISHDGVNHIRGDCIGDVLTLYLNGQALLQVEDSDYASGGTGLVARSGPSSAAGLDALFSNFSLTGK